MLILAEKNMGQGQNVNGFRRKLGGRRHQGVLESLVNVSRHCCTKHDKLLDILIHVKYIDIWPDLDFHIDQTDATSKKN